MPPLLDFSRNHFELFGFPAVYSLDLVQLSERYRALQRTLHPDRFAAAGDQVRRLSLQASTRVNEAYRVLKDPLERASYLLSLHTDALADSNETIKDMAFLTEQMELREALADVKSVAEPDLALARITDRLDEQAERLIAQLTVRLDGPGPDDLAEAQELVRKLQFVNKCRLEAEQLQGELDGSL
jgi:molecular chaperone HscB